MRASRHLPVLAAILLALAAVGLTRATPAASAFNYVENGGFEQGTDRWALVSPDSTFDTDPDAVAPSEGAARGRITLAEGRFTLTQTSLAGAPAGPYHFSVRLRATSDALLVSAQVLSSSPVAVYWKEEASYLSSGWSELSGTVDVTGYDSIIIRIGGTGSPGDVVYVDDVRFEGAPPATMTPTDTPVPATETPTPVPPTPTKTPKSTATEGEATPAGPTPAVEAGSTTLASDSVLNGGFEEVAGDGLPVAWEKYGGEFAASSSVARTGAHSALLQSSTESTKWLYQPVRVSGGASYSFDAWILLNDPSVSSSWLRISWYAAGDATGEALDTSDSIDRLDAASDEWRRLTTGSVTAPAGAASAKLRVMLQPVSGATAALYVDDASFALSDPPPAAITMSEQSDIAVAPAAAQQALTESSRRSPDRHPAPGKTIGTRILSRLVINEVLYDSIAEGPDADGEWVELFNAGPSSVSLEGWALADNRSVEHLPAVTVLPGAFAIVTGSPDFLDRNPGFAGTLVLVEGAIGNSLGNNGDVLVLVDPSGSFVDALSWGNSTAALDPPIQDVPAGHSIERRIPGGDNGRASDFIDNEQPSPGRAYGQVEESSRVSTAEGSPVQILSGDSGFSFGWLPWVLAAVSMAALAGVASWRLLPPLASRLRHP